MRSTARNNNRVKGFFKNIDLPAIASRNSAKTTANEENAAETHLPGVQLRITTYILRMLSHQRCFTCKVSNELPLMLDRC